MFAFSSLEAVHIFGTRPSSIFKAISGIEVKKRTLKVHLTVALKLCFQRKGKGDLGRTIIPTYFICYFPSLPNKRGPAYNTYAIYYLGMNDLLRTKFFLLDCRIRRWRLDACRHQLLYILLVGICHK